jgi:hypothetical protein
MCFSGDCLQDANRTPLKGSHVVATRSTEDGIPLLQLDQSETKIVGYRLARFLCFDLSMFSKDHEDRTLVPTV